MADAEFELLWNLPARALDAPNRRGTGTSTVALVEADGWPLAATTGRVYLKRQQAFFCRPAWNAFRRTPTLRRERRFLERARAIGLDVPRIVYYGEARDRAILAVEAVDATVDFEQALARANDAERARIVERVGDALATLHAARIRHGALYPKHILVGSGEPPRVVLIDFEKGRGTWGRRRAAAVDLDRLARHAPFLTGGDWGILRARYDSPPADRQR
jgi:tRNA A-37 threonylcarbamoyl transferase component Bud32